MRANSPRKHSDFGPPDTPAEPEPIAEDGCIYCLPPAADEAKPAATQPAHECIIKRLGTWERRQVSVALHRAGFEQHLFTCGCPASETRSFRSCPFYENQQDLDRDDP